MSGSLPSRPPSVIAEEAIALEERDKVTIYALHEPGGDPWYVGCTNDLRRRFAAHRSPSSKLWQYITPDTRIGVIETVSMAESRKAEDFSIDYGRGVGWPLVNLNAGGGARRYTAAYLEPSPFEMWRVRLP